MSPRVSQEVPRAKGHTMRRAQGENGSWGLGLGKEKVPRSVWGSETRAPIKLTQSSPRAGVSNPTPKPYNHFLQSCCAPGWEAFPLGCTPCCRALPSVLLMARCPFLSSQDHPLLHAGLRLESGQDVRQLSECCLASLVYLGWNKGGHWLP